MQVSLKASQIEPSSTLEITAKANQMKSEGIDVIGFGAGEPDFDTPEHIKKAAITAIKDGFTKYTPATGIKNLKEAICKKLHKDNGLEYTANQIVVSNGAKHSLLNTFNAILNPGDEVIVPAPFWLSYTQMVKMADGKPVIIKTKKENNFTVTLEELESVLTDKTRAIIINSPNNPTGMIYSEEQLRKIGEFAVKNNLYIVSDEIYEKLIYDCKEHISIASLSKEIYDRTIVINGVSKSYSMTGWRIGYAAANEKIAKLMGNMQSHASSNPNSIAQLAALAAISGPQDCVLEMKEAFELRRNYMIEKIKSMKYIDAKKPNGAFYVFVNISSLFGKQYNGKEIKSGKSFAKILLNEKNVAVVPCTDFGFDDHIRLSYAISLDNIKEGLNRIEDFINGIN